jgi:hypothetical protein
LRNELHDKEHDLATTEESDLMIRVVCGCGRVFKAEDRHAGKRTKCPVCGTTLTIGGTPVSSSSGGDFDEVPSWWYPSDPQGQSAPVATSSGGVGDIDSMRTAVSPSGPNPGHMNPLGNHPRLTIAANGARLQSPTPASSRVRRLWALSASTATLAVLALGAIVWMGWTMPEDGRPPRPAGAPSVKSVDTVPGEPASASPRAIPSRAVAGDEGGSAIVAGNAPPPKEAAGGLPAHMVRRLRLLVPAYIYPDAEGRKAWRKLIAAASKVDLVAVVNPNSGPGSARNSDYIALIADAGTHGVKLVGYVSTEYGERTPAEVKRDIDRWVQFYPQVAGFFLDQQSCEARRSAYYVELRAYAKDRLRDALVITNPGGICDKSFPAWRTSDVTCVFSNNQGFGTFELPAEFKVYEPSRFAALAYKIADVETMRAMIEDAILKRIGYIYITDAAPAHQWERLPGYWEAEVEAVARVQ